MGNGGGGTLLIGVEDDPPAIVGLVDNDARRLCVGLRKLVAERFIPPPTIRPYRVATEHPGQSIVVVDVRPAWEAANPIYMPSMVVKESQDASGRVIDSVGTIIVRVDDDCKKIQTQREWDSVMTHVLARYRREMVRPMLESLVGVVGPQPVAAALGVSRTQSVEKAIASLPAELSALSHRFPKAAIYDCRLVLDGVELTPTRQQDLVRQCSVPTGGWAVPIDVPNDARAQPDGTFSMTLRRPSGRWFGPVDEWWSLAPSGHFVSILASRVDLYSTLDGVRLEEPGPNRALDAPELGRQILAWLMFASQAASYAGARNLWTSITVSNVLGRRVGPCLDIERPIVQRIVVGRIPGPASTVRRLRWPGSSTLKR